MKKRGKECMETDAWRLIFDVVQFVLTGAIAIYVYLSNKNRITHARISAFEKATDDLFDDQESRLVALETTIRYLPVQSDVGKLGEALGRVGGDVRVVRAEVEGVRELIKPMQRTMELMNEFLLKQGG